MPQLKVDYVVSFSSEHPEHPVNNLLSKDIGNKRWLSLGKGDSSNSVVMQLEKSAQITSIHIGNYHSALVEVLVGRSEAPNQQYEVLLSTSTFMTPSDSRNSANISNVRTFNCDQLVKSTQTKMWDRVRVVCTQPYNRHVQYGLSFIHFFSSDTIPSTITQNSQSTVDTKMIGRFKLKDESESDDFGLNFKPGELFAKSKQNVLSADVQIRKAGSPQNLKNNPFSTLLVKSSRPSTSKNTSSTGTLSKDCNTLSRKKDKLIYLDDDDDHDEKIDAVIKRDKDEKSKLAEIKSISDQNKEKNLPQTKNVNSASKASSSPAINTSNKVKNCGSALKKKVNENILNSADDDRNEGNNVSTVVNKTNANFSKNSSSNEASTSNKKKRDHSPAQTPTSSKKVCTENETRSENLDQIKRGPDCLRGVTFILSGYVNPKRSNLRDTAISLGARYSPDWNSNCTHLICAFPNTPKHDQVRRAGGCVAVVTGEWIEECGKEKAHLPYKWFATDPKLRVPRPKVDLSINVPTTNIANKNDDDIDLNRYDNDTKIVGDDDVTDMEEDTDDEIEKIMKLQAISNATNKEEKIKENIKKIQMSDDDSNMTESDLETNENTDSPKKKTKRTKELDPYDVDTESDSEMKNKTITGNGAFEVSPEKSLPDFFSGLKFYIDPKLSDENVSDFQLKRYILAYSGDLVNKWPDPQIDVAITTDNLVDNLKCDVGKKCKFLNPEWVWKCNDKKTLYSFKQYEIL